MVLIENDISISIYTTWINLHNIEYIEAHLKAT